MDGMDEALDQIVSGTYDLATEANKAKKAAEVQAKAESLMMDFQRAQMAEEWPKVLEIADKMLELDPEQFAQAGLYKYFITTTKLKDKAKASAIAENLISDVFKKDAQNLGTLAMVISSHPEIMDADRDLDLALKAAEKANELEEGSEPMLLATLAKVYSARKDHKAAAEWQIKAIEKADDPELKKVLEEELATIKSAADGAPATPAPATP